MLKIEIVGDQDVSRKFQNLPEKIRQALRTKIFALTLTLEAHIKLDKLSGQVLKTVSGRLKRSIQSEVIDRIDQITGTVFSSGDVPYNAIHEFGGKTSASEIVPVKAKALRFMFHGKLTFAKRVHHPGSVMPERSFMRSGLSDMKEKIISELTSTVREAAKL